MDEFDTWDKRISAVRPIFEVAGFALTTFTWNALAFTAVFAAIRGYWHPTPALASTGTHGTIIYLAFTAFVTLFSGITIATLNLSLLSLANALKRDLTNHRSWWVIVPMAFLSGPATWAAIMYILIMSMFLGFQFAAVLKPA